MAAVASNTGGRAANSRSRSQRRAIVSLTIITGADFSSSRPMGN
jgi:hypothetical protein